MSVKFSIKNTADKAEREGDVTVRFTGTSEPFNRHSERACRKVGVDGAGNPKLVFNTGLDSKQVQFYSWLTADEKKALLDTIKELKPLIEDFYGGPSVTVDTNQFFWREDRNVNRLSLKNENIGTFFDTERASHALLYLSILSGAFIDLVAPSKDWAERYQVPHYMALEIENNDYGDEEEDIKRSDAHMALGDLRMNHGKEALYILAWCMQYDTNAFGAYNYSTTEKDLINYHIRFIDGKLVSKKKKNMPKTFLSYYEKWKGAQTRPLLFAEAYVKAGEYFNFLNQREKKYTTIDGTILGNTVEDAVKSLVNKPQFKVDFEKLRDLVEAKWKE